MSLVSDQLITRHAGVARRIALRMAGRIPSRVAAEDLVAAGYLGLTEAARRHDDREPFLPFAEQRIRGAILDELRRNDVLPRRASQLAREIAATIVRLDHTGESVSDDRVAAALGVDVDAYRDRRVRLGAVDVALRADAAADAVADELLPDAQAVAGESRSRVKDGLVALAPRDATVLRMHFLEEQTFQEIATALAITPSRACQLLWRAVDRLRAQLGVHES